MLNKKHSKYGVMYMLTRFGFLSSGFSFLLSLISYLLSTNTEGFYNMTLEGNFLSTTSLHWSHLFIIGVLC